MSICYVQAAFIHINTSVTQKIFQFTDRVDRYLEPDIKGLTWGHLSEVTGLHRENWNPVGLTKPRSFLCTPRTDR